MRPYLSQVAGIAALTDDLDVGLLARTRAYLECRFRRRTPSGELVEAWEEFYQSYDPLLRQFALACHVSGGGLEDCLQQVWTELVLKLRHFRYDRRRGRFRSWLYTVVHSKATDLLRGNTRYATAHLSSEAAAALRGRHGDPVAEYEQRRKKEAVRQVLALLRRRVSASNYRVLHLRWLEGWTVQEIAAALGLTPAQVRLRAHRMKEQFRRLFDLYTGER